ncbi:MAG: response regulator [Anaerolineales bacterium]|nr:response regulator [Anaerolineales bacterium]
MPTEGSILIADDEANNRHLLRMLLQPLGHTLVETATGPETLAAARQAPPDLLLLDVMMPDLDGFDVCRQLRQDPATAEMVILLVTALDDRASRLQGIEAGADDFISKPFDRVELRTRVQTIMRLNRYRRLVVERQRFAWLIEQAAEGYLLLAERPAETLLYANPRARQYLGLAPVEALGPLPFEELARRHYRFEPEHSWAAGRTPCYLIRPETAAAPAIWLEVAELPAPATLGAGRVVRLRDVTEAMGLKRGAWSFTSITSHKFLTPLGAINGSLEMLETFADDMTPAELRQLTGMARRGVERLQRQINDLLRYANATQWQPEPAPFALAALPALVQELAAEIGLASVAVTLAPEAAAETVWPGPQTLELILRELLANARKFHPHGAPAVAVRVAAETASRITLQVWDDGRTVPLEQLTEIWTPFYQAEKTMTGQVPGMGLGLAMVAALIWTSGGECRAYNRPDGPGLIVELSLPAADPPPA